MERVVRLDKNLMDEKTFQLAIHQPSADGAAEFADVTSPDMGQGNILS
jgi:hypothetical protein